MELGSDKLSWFTYVPRFMRNRELPDGERMSVELRKMSTVDLLAQRDDRDALIAWRDEHLEKWLKGEHGEAIREFSPSILLALRQFTENTRKFRNFVFDGEEEKDPFAIFILAPPGITSEINDTITQVASMFGDDLKNFVSQFDGSTSATSPTTTASGAQVAPEDSEG